MLVQRNGRDKHMGFPFRRRRAMRAPVVVEPVLIEALAPQPVEPQVLAEPEPEIGLKLPPEPKSKFRAAAITMVYNERDNLPLWCKYYGRQLGPENLYVIDHGSTDGSVDSRLCNHIRIPRTAFDDNTRGEMVSYFHRSLLKYFDVVMYTDCDEFIVARPSKFASLREFLEKRVETTTRCIGINVWQHAMDVPPLDMTKPILRQRPYGSASHWLAKPLIASVPNMWTPGFHNSDQHSVLNGDAWLFHLKHADLSTGLQKLERTRSLEWSAEALARNQGDHHRWQDDDLRRMFALAQRGRTEDSLDGVDFTHMFRHRGSGNLRRIPEEFLDAF